MISRIKNKLETLPVIGKITRSFVKNSEIRKFQDILSNNESFKNKYNGRRCFIIGNGPSLSGINLKQLEKEYTFVVNNMMISDQYDVIKPKFYVISDSNFFKKENSYTQNNINVLLNKRDKPVCFFPIKNKEFVEKQGWDKKVEVSYFLSDTHKEEIKEIDITKTTPASYNVINQCLFLAISMGFSAIYLLGCDMTGFIMTFDENGTPSEAGHFYKSEADDKYVESRLRERRNENVLRSYAKVFETFRLTNDYAMKHKIKIVNLTNGGALDVFPREKYKEIINKSK